jgi:hypothetical protein
MDLVSSTVKPELSRYLSVGLRTGFLFKVL